MDTKKIVNKRGGFVQAGELVIPFLAKFARDRRNRKTLIESIFENPQNNVHRKISREIFEYNEDVEGIALLNAIEKERQDLGE